MDSIPFESAHGPPRWAGEATSSGGRPEAPPGGRGSQAAECRALGEALAQVCRAQAAVVDAAVDLVVEVRARVLERRGLTGSEPGGATARSLLAEIRRCAVSEVQVRAGYAVGEARTLVALALGSERLRAVVTGAMRRGECSWPLVRRLWESGSHLTDDQRHLVAVALLGTDDGVAVPERLDPDGQLVLGRAWSHDEFTAACDREVSACEGVDVAAERERRRRAYAGRGASMRLNDDGTGTLSVRGPLATMAAVYQRVDRGARNARALGDERTLSNLRCDLVSALLVYGSVELPSQKSSDATKVTPPGEADAPPPAETETPPPADTEAPAPDGNTCSTLPVDEIVAPEDMDRLVRVVNALPPVALQVVVPLDVLSPVVDRCPHCGEGAGEGEEARPRRSDAPEEAPPQVPGVSTAKDPAPAPAKDLGPAPPGDPGAGEDSVPEWMEVLATWLPEGPGRGQVGEVLGPVPFSISPGLARELALTPGATVHRLVTDPEDGRCVERSAKGYRPDADMRRQIHAADVYSRAPGSRSHAAACELDHVTPWGWAGGPTTEANLAMLDLPAHRSKTEGYLEVTINQRRDLTFTTLLGQVVTTRVHDYGQYLRRLAPDDLATRRDRANRLVYAAYAADPRRGQAPSGLRRPPDDDAWLTLTHTVLGRRRVGVAPDAPTVEDLLGAADGTADSGDDDS